MWIPSGVNKTSGPIARATTSHVWSIFIQSCASSTEISSGYVFSVLSDDLYDGHFYVGTATSVTLMQNRFGSDSVVHHGLINQSAMSQNLQDRTAIGQAGTYLCFPEDSTGIHDCYRTMAAHKSSLRPAHSAFPQIATRPASCRCPDCKRTSAGIELSDRRVPS